MSDIDPELFKQVEAELRADEGYRVHIYDDSNGRRIESLRTGGNVTVGIGRNLSARAFSEDEIELMFRNDVTIALGIARKLVPTFDTLSPNRRAAILNLGFNLGEERLSKFTSTLAAINDGRWMDAATHLLDSRWATQVQPSRRDRIVKQVRYG